MKRKLNSLLPQSLPKETLRLVSFALFLIYMSVRKQIEKEAGIYFITVTCCKWLPLFQKADAYDAVFKWFDALKREGNKIASFVIMPNHLHALIYFANTSKSVNQYTGTGKRFMAYEIVKSLRSKNENGMLDILAKGVNETQKALGKKHQVFEPSFAAKQCISNTFTLQKLHYIHNNPCSGKWQLCDNPADYFYSSAKQYIDNIAAAYTITLLSDIEAFSFF